MITYNTVEHTGHETKMAPYLTARQRGAIRRKLLINRDTMSNADIITTNMEEFFAPIRAEHPEWTDADIRQHLESLDMPRDFFLTHADVENIRQVCQRSYAL